MPLFAQSFLQDTGTTCSGNGPLTRAQLTGTLVREDKTGSSLKVVLSGPETDTDDPAWGVQRVQVWTRGDVVKDGDCPAVGQGRYATTRDGSVRTECRDLFATCNALHTALPDAPSGTYLIDPDGKGGPLPPQLATCDMDTPGTVPGSVGGWTMVLNYRHGANSTVLQMANNAYLPVMGQDDLGSGEEGTSAWGHAGTQLFAALKAKEVRFYCRSSMNSGRVLHFATNSVVLLKYLETGEGTPPSIYSQNGGAGAAFQPLQNHNANLPGGTTAASSDGGAGSLAVQPFWRNASPAAFWNVGHVRTRWECDDENRNQSNTLHRVWVR